MMYNNVDISVLETSALSPYKTAQVLAVFTLIQALTVVIQATVIVLTAFLMSGITRL